MASTSKAWPFPYESVSEYKPSVSCSRFVSLQIHPQQGTWQQSCLNKAVTKHSHTNKLRRHVLHKKYFPWVYWLGLIFMFTVSSSRYNLCRIFHQHERGFALPYSIAIQRCIRHSKRVGNQLYHLAGKLELVYLISFNFYPVIFLIAAQHK